MITLYDLVAADPVVAFSPYCWRVKFALKHKGLEFAAVPCCFTDKEVFAFSNHKQLPVVKDGDKTICDSWRIVSYLEDQYPNTPSVFGSRACRDQALFLKFWCETKLQPAMLPLILIDIVRRLHAKDKRYFRETREARFGKPLEAVCTQPVAELGAFRAVLEPVRAVVREQPYLAGTAPMFADYMVMAHFLCARMMSPIELIEPFDPVFAWRERMLEALDGYGRRAPSAVC